MSTGNDGAIGPLRLILMRHAKSDWGNDGSSDHDRKLNDRGRRDAPRIADWAADQGYQPDLILCSSATRTRQTADLMVDQWDLPTAVFVSKRLYLGSPAQIFSVVHDDSVFPGANAENTPRTVLVLAHNPGISEAAGWLMSQMVAMSTAALAVFDFEGPDWTAPMTPQTTRFVGAIKPKAITGSAEDRVK